MAINIIPGDPAADGYIDEIGADAYMATRVDGGEWDAADTATKEEAIKNSTRLLDDLNWKGTKNFPAGSLRWPRAGVFDRDDIELDATTIPGTLGNATAEYAYLLIAGKASTTAPDTAGIKRIELDVLEIEFDTDRDNPTQSTQAVPDSVFRMIQHWLAGSLFALDVCRT